MNRLNSSEFDILDAMRHLNMLSQGEIVHKLIHFSELLRSGNVSNEIQHDFARKLAIYLSRKINDLETEVHDPHGENGKEALWQIRNEIVHGVYRHSRNYEKFFPILWRELNRVAKNTEPMLFEKMMSFCFRYSNPEIYSETYNSNKICRMYKDYFKTLSIKDQNEIFANLLMRMFDRSSMNF